MSGMQRNEKFKLVFTAIAIIFAGIATGLLLSGNLLPFPPAVLLQYEKTTMTEKAVSSMVDNAGEYTKTTTVIATETTPHGYSHDFAATLMPHLGNEPIASTQTRGTNEIWVGDRDFIPSVLTVAVGATVTWTSKTGDSHTVTSDTGLFDEALGPSTSFNYTFTKAGSYEYYCVPHSGMAGVINVK